MILSEKMPSVSVKDVSQQEFTVALAAFLKKWVDSYTGWFYLTGPPLKLSLDWPHEKIPQLPPPPSALKKFQVRWLRKGDPVYFNMFNS